MIISKTNPKEISKGISNKLAIHETIKEDRKVTTNPIMANRMVLIAAFILVSSPPDRMKLIPPMIMNPKLKTKAAIIANATNVAITSTGLLLSKN